MSFPQHVMEAAKAAVQDKRSADIDRLVQKECDGPTSERRPVNMLDPQKVASTAKSIVVDPEYIKLENDVKTRMKEANPEKSGDLDVKHSNLDAAMLKRNEYIETKAKAAGVVETDVIYVISALANTASEELPARQQHRQPVPPKGFGR